MPRSVTANNLKRRLNRALPDASVDGNQMPHTPFKTNCLLSPAPAHDARQPGARAVLIGGF